MAFSKIILNGTTLMDVTGDTVAANNLLDGYTATGADGEAVTGAYVAPTFSTQAKTNIDPTTSSQTITPDTGYDGLSSVQINAMPSGTAGTPTATKSAVSNHAVTVTPSVTNSTGYITGGTKTGTAVSVSAAELVSGSQNITENDTYDVTNLAEVVVSVSGGEAGQEELTIDAGVVFIDYDGIIVEEWETADVAGKTDLPNNPSHSGLTAQGWNYTLANIKTYIANYPDAILVVGQMYITTSGATEIDVVLSSDTLQPYLGIAPNGTVTVDWGDNSTTSTLTGTSLTSLKWANHTYTTGGEYTIKLSVESGSFNFYGTTNGYGSILSRTNSFNYSHLYNNTIRAIRLGASAGIGQYGVVTSYMLQTISIPKTANISGQYAFNSNYMLRCIVVPNGTTTLGQYWSAYSYGLHFVSVPQEVTSIGAYAHVNNNFIKAYSVPQGVATISSYTLNGCTNAKRITFPNSVTSIASNGANNTYSLNRLTIPSSITSLQASCLANMRSLYKLRFEKTTPPTVSSSNVWTNLGTWCVISVPTGSLSDYTSATNYPSSSTYTYIEEA